ncbi:unnamed protein product [Urochloa decumbens]|uniref:Protein kinase domain-containing protein n=1 Tax=Urochloa decumbens TaxID=240449 RepID=A0ABC9GFW7_9POAL
MDGESSKHMKLDSILHDKHLNLHSLSLKDLREITNDFSDERLLGQGGFGRVYKGLLQNGDIIAVKKLQSTMPGLQDKQYENEVCHLMRLAHPNIVQLVGCCSETEEKLVLHNEKYVYAEKSERLLCLEYLPKGSLRNYISDAASGLDWDARYKIIADFGLSRLFGEEQTRTTTKNLDGTLGYMAPEYLNNGIISKQLDIFSLGVIIIQVVTGDKHYPDEDEISSQEFFELVLKNWRNRLEKVSGYTSQESDCRQIGRCVEIGLLCVKFDRAERPTTRRILKMLASEDTECRTEREGRLEHLGSSRNADQTTSKVLKKRHAQEKTRHQVRPSSATTIKAPVRIKKKKKQSKPRSTTAFRGGSTSRRNFLEPSTQGCRISILDTRCVWFSFHLLYS